MYVRFANSVCTEDACRTHTCGYSTYRWIGGSCTPINAARVAQASRKSLWGFAGPPARRKVQVRLTEGQMLLGEDGRPYRVGMGRDQWGASERQVRVLVEKWFEEGWS